MIHRRDQDDSLPIATYERIDREALAFEAAWSESLQGPRDRPQAADFLEGFAGDERTELLRALLLLELEYRRQAGERPEMEAYLAEFPQNHEAVRSAFQQEREQREAAALSSRLALRESLRSTPLVKEGSRETGVHDALAQDDQPIPGEFGDYEILERLGRGGMGVVFKARQRSLNRVVALKMILSGRYASREEIERFRAEAESAARLRHPHIVPIYEIGEHEGRQFFSMGYVDGASLDQLTEESPLTSRDAAAYVRTVAEAVHFAHEQGVLHRDLKPSNVLIDIDDQPHVADFGLAKNAQSDHELTMTGQVLGTPNYISPEQALGRTKHVGPRSDVYSLGAMLYALVTGRPPFNAETTAATIMQLIEQEPVAPRLLNPSIDRDLETVILKCLQKDPGGRYASAKELADDLNRYLENVPIHARPIGVVERTWRWCRKNPLVASLGMATASALLVGMTVAIYFSILSDRAAHRAQMREQEANESRALAEQQTASLAKANYFQRIALAQRDLETKNLTRADEMLRGCAEPLRGWEWHYLNRRRVSPPREIEIGSDAGYWLAIHPNGKYVAVATWQGSLELIDFRTGQKIHSFKQPRSTIQDISFSPDGNRLLGVAQQAYYDDVLFETIQMWDVESGERVGFLRNETHTRVPDLAVHPAGRDYVSGSKNDQDLTVWDPATLRPKRRLTPPGNALIDLSYSHDGRWLLGTFRSGVSRIWDAETWEPLRDLSHHDEFAEIKTAAFSPDNSMVVIVGRGGALGESGVILIWDVKTGQLRHRLLGHSQLVRRAVFSADSQRLASVGDDGSLIFWDIESGQAVLNIAAHAGPILDVAVSPDDSRLLTTGVDGKLRVWVVGPDGGDEDASPPLLVEYRQHEGPVYSLAFSADGKRIISGGSDNVINVWDPSSGQRLCSINRKKENGGSRQFENLGRVNELEFRYDGDSLHAWTTAHGYTTWDAASGELLNHQHFYAARGVDTHPQRDGLAYAKLSSVVLTQGTPAHDRTWVSEAHDDWAIALDHSPDGTRLASGGTDGIVNILDTTRTKSGDVNEFRVHRLVGHTKVVRTVKFGPHAKNVVSGGDDGTVRLWNAETGEALHLLDEHSGTVNSVAISHDGNWIASAGQDGTVKVWHAGTGNRVINFSRHDGAVYKVAFHPQQLRLASCGVDGRVKIWDLADIASKASATDAADELWVSPREKIRHTHPITFIDDVQVTRDGKAIDEYPAGWTAIMRYPRDGKFQLSLGKIGYVDQMEILPPADAQQHFTARLKEEPDSFKWRLAVALVKYFRQDSQAAERELDELLSEQPDHFWSRLARGRVRLDRDNIAGAIEDFSTAIEAEPEDSRGYMWRGVAFDRQGDGKKALVDHNAAVARDANRATVFLERGRSHAQAGRFDKALVDFERAIELDREFTQAYLAVGDVYLQQDKPKRAMVNFDVAVALEWFNADAYAARSEAYLQMGDKGAIQVSGYALRLRADHRRARRVRAIMHIRQGEFSKGIEMLDSLLEDDPDNAELLDHREAARREQKKRAAATESE